MPAPSQILRPNLSPRVGVLLVALFTLTGCGGADREAGYRVSGYMSGEEYSPDMAVDNSSSMSLARPEMAGQDAEGSQQPTSDAIPGDRKIIYQAEVDLVVEDFTSLAKAVPELVERYNGYIADANVQSTQGANRRGRWQVRIPTDSFNAFLDDVSDLGVPEDTRQKAQDVTEEFVDLEAQISSKKRLEERILQLLENPQGGLEEVIKVEEELARIRSEIERMEGRLRYLTNRTSLTTVTINAREEKDYQPPQAPSFGGQVGDTWSSSIDSLQSAGEATALFFVGITPWLPVIIVLLLMVWFLYRKLFRRGTATT